MKLPRALWRCARLLGHVLHGLWVVTLRFPRMSQEQQYIRVQAWSQQLLACAGISLRVQGTPPVRGPVMLVANVAFGLILFAFFDKNRTPPA